MMVLIFFLGGADDGEPSQSIDSANSSNLSESPAGEGKKKEKALLAAKSLQSKWIP